MIRYLCIAFALLLGLSGCTLMPAKPVAALHLSDVGGSQVRSDVMPAMNTVAAAPVSIVGATLAKKKITVTVNKVPAAELLWTIAKDAKINLDIAADIDALVTVNLVDQPLGLVFGRIAEQGGLRYSLQNGVMHVERDRPYLRDYKVDYVNLQRTSKGDVNISTSLSGMLSATSGTANSSATTLTSTAEHHFWRSLTESIRSILKEEDRLVTVSRAVSTETSGESASHTSNSKVVIDGQSTSVPINQEVALSEREERVIANPEGGIISVRATTKQHQQIAAFLDQALRHAGRQVLIEATIAEVLLTDEFQSGVDWSRLLSDGQGLGVSQQLIAGRMGASPVTTITYQNKDTGLFSGQLSTTIKLLESFGKTKVLSSPKIMALNNQTALLKVVDEKVYFTVTLDESKNDKGDVTDRKFTSALHTVPVGVVMSVLPQVSEDGQVILNIRPSISRITGYKQDPVPQLMNATFQNLVPEIQVREMESILKIPDGQTVVLGGLMQDEVINVRDGVPLLHRVPVVGDLFAYQSQENRKSELVIFLRPVVIQSTRYQALLDPYKTLLPSPSFLSQAIEEPSLSVVIEK